MVALKAGGLTKRFEAVCALDNVDLVVGPGEVRGLLGPNGAGKTTLLRLIFGLLRADAGTIEVLGRRRDGVRPTWPRTARPVLEGVAGLVEEPAFYPYLSGRANLEVLGELDDDGARGRIEHALEQVGLAARAQDRVAGYSSGMRQRLGIAAALMRAPRLLLLDEPTSALDPSATASTHELLRTLAGRGAAVLLSSHRIEEVERVCDSFTVLKQGRVVWEGSAQRMLAEAPRSAYRMATSDDERALELARGVLGVLAQAVDGGGLTIEADDGALDAYALVLGHADVSIRRLELTTGALESMFLSLTC